jgi:hypothetical protein
MTARNNVGGVTIRDAYNRFYGARAAYACAVTSHINRRIDEGMCFLWLRAEAVFSVLRAACRDYIREIV